VTVYNVGITHEVATLILKRLLLVLVAITSSCYTRRRQTIGGSATPKDGVRGGEAPEEVLPVLRTEAAGPEAEPLSCSSQSALALSEAQQNTEDGI
jgi:hypothetical protein